MGWREGDRALPTPALAVEFGLRIDEWRDHMAFPYTIRSGVAEVWCSRTGVRIAREFCLPQRKVAQVAQCALWLMFRRYPYNAAIESNLLDLRSELVELTEMALGCHAHEMFLHARAAFGVGKLGAFCVPKRKRLLQNLLSLFETCRRGNLTLYNPRERWRIGVITGLHIPCACISLVGKRSRQSRWTTQISIVECDASVARTFHPILTSAGFSVRSVDSLSALFSDPISQIVVCDLRLLDSSFLAIIRKCTVSFRPTVIAISRGADSVLRRWALLNGVSAIVERDDDPEILLAWCKKLSVREEANV